MKKESGLLPLAVCASLIVLSVLLVVLGHRQGDAIAAKATPISAAVATPAASATSVSVQVTVTPGAAAAASSALAKPAAAD